MQIAQNNADQYIVKPPQNQFFDFNQVCVPSLYIVLPQAGWEVTVVEEEATDKEILRCLERSGNFDFLNDQKEDIYGPSDGEPV